MLAATDIYRWLMQPGERNACDAFDAHVVACVFALALEATQQGIELTESTGLTSDEMLSWFVPLFPHAEHVLSRAPPQATVVVAEDEAMLRDLLFGGSSEGSELERNLAKIVARRCQRPNHLWQDLGLRNRRELSWLMTRHFEPLATRNKNDMKWKKFLYRAICRDTNFSLCPAPVCSECDDFDGCFGDEAGESLLSAALPALDSATKTGESR